VTAEERALVKEEARLARALGKEAKVVWAAAKRQAGLAKFADKASLARVAEYAELCYRRVDAYDVLKAAAIVGKMYDGAPWMLADEAQRICSLRLQLEHDARKYEDRAHSERIRQGGGLMKHLRPE
jgi:hypothetical protein